VVIQAGPLVIARNGPGTGEIREDLTHHVQSLVGGPGGRIGPVVTGSVVEQAAGRGDFRKRVLPMNLDIRVPFVILEPDIIARLVLLDQGILKK
jgi:hypothetical protein